MKFKIYEITSIRRFDEITCQIDKFADSVGKPLDGEPHWVNAHTLVTDVEWGDRKNTHMLWRRVQAQLAEAVKTLGQGDLPHSHLSGQWRQPQTNQKSPLPRISDLCTMYKKSNQTKANFVQLAQSRNFCAMCTNPPPKFCATFFQKMLDFPS